VLAQWSGECETPIAYLIDAATGRVDDAAPAGTDSYAIGWTPEGKAIVGIGGGPCSNEDFTATGTFLVDPPEKVRTRIHAFSAGTTVPRASQYLFNRLERRVDRAITELGLEGCCGEPNHGSESNSAGMIVEGVEVAIYAVPRLWPATSIPSDPSNCASAAATTPSALARRYGAWS
jgi:hypothetical protein